MTMTATDEAAMQMMMKTSASRLLFVNGSAVDTSLKIETLREALITIGQSIAVTARKGNVIVVTVVMPTTTIDAVAMDLLIGIELETPGVVIHEGLSIISLILPTCPHSFIGFYKLLLNGFVLHSILVF